MLNKDQSITTDNMEIGDNAKDVLQVNGHYIDMRSDYLVIKEVFTDLYNANNYKIQQELMSRVEDKINLLSRKFAEAIDTIKVKSEVSNHNQIVQSMNDPSTQMLANQCLYQSVYKNEDHTVEILAKLLAEKVTKEKKDYIIEDCVESLKFISMNDINYISLIYSISYKSYRIGIYFLDTYFDQVQSENFDKEQKELRVEQITKRFIDLYNKIGSYFLELNTDETDYNYLMNKGWFYTNLINVPDPLQTIASYLKKIDGSNYSLTEIQELIPKLNEAWIKYNGKDFQGNRLSSISMLLASIHTDDLLEKIDK